MLDGWLSQAEQISRRPVKAEAGQFAGILEGGTLELEEAWYSLALDVVRQPGLAFPPVRTFRLNSCPSSSLSNPSNS
jgi:hypothetical protein